MAIDEFAEFEGMESILEAGEEGLVLVDQAEDDPPVPFWRISKTDVAPLLKILREIAQRSSDQISRSVLLAPDGQGNLRITATNKDVYFSGVVPLKNNQNVLDEAMIFNVKQLEDIVKYSYDLVIYKEEGKVLATFMKGSQPLEVFAFNRTIYDVPNFYLQPKVAKLAVGIDSVDLKCQTDMFFALMSLASVAEDRRVVIKDGAAYGSFVSVASKVCTRLPDMVLKSTDARDLSGILSIYPGEVNVVSSKDRIFFFNDFFVYTSFLLDEKVSDEMIGKFEEGLEQTFIDGNQFYNITSYLASTNVEASVMNMVSDKNGIVITCKNKNGNQAKFSLSRDPAPDMNMDLQIVLARNVFRILRKSPTISLSKPFANVVEFSAGDVRVLQGCRDKG